jgi:hypothetical protein
VRDQNRATARFGMAKVAYAAQGDSFTISLR